MTIPAVHCEARKAAYRQSKEGLVVSFVIHPNDMPDALAVAPLGQRYMLALAAIGDDEQPVEQPPPASHHPDTGWRSGSMKDEPSAASQRGKERYASSTPMEQALVRAARLSTDQRFLEWTASVLRKRDPERYAGLVGVGVPVAAQYIRDRCCEGGSRGLIAENPDCYQRFIAMETEYKIATGEMAEPR